MSASMHVIIEVVNSRNECTLVIIEISEYMLQ